MENENTILSAGHVHVEAPPPTRLVEEEEQSPSMSPSPSLPADDGMEGLRQKMREIHNLAVSTEEKARKMHLLMTRDYMALNKEPTVHPKQDHMAVNNEYNISPDDLETSYCPEPVPLCDDEDMPHHDESRRALGCQHYSRNVKVQCYDCKLWFPCRHCHDSSNHLPFPHHLNRKMTENMLCMVCKTPQPAGEDCIKCGQETAYYYCPKCKLWDNDSTKRIYHCDDCGICRRGEGLGKDYVHCKRCNVCISISTSSTHPCIERATDCDCPLCLEYLFSSPLPVVSLLCGHYMHAACYKDLMTVTYRCPVCNKSAVNMELQWRKLDDEIRMQPMPEEDFAPLSEEEYTPTTNTEQLQSQPIPRRRVVPRKVWVGCNDCGGRGWTPFHWLGLKCTVCDGYNTTQTTPLGNVSSIPRPPTYGLQRQHDFTGVDAIRSFGDGSGEGGAAGLGPDGRGIFGETSIGDDEERADSAYAPNCIPVESDWRPSGQTRPSYFLRAEQEEGSSGAGLLRPDRALSASAEMFGGVPYEMVMRLGRSLSPMRYYIEGLDLGGDSHDEQKSEHVEKGHEQAPSRPRTPQKEHAAANVVEDQGFWSAENQRRFLAVFHQGDNDDGEDDDGEEEEGDDEDEDEDDDESDDESNTSEADRLDAEDEEEAQKSERKGYELDLPGHM